MHHQRQNHWKGLVLGAAGGLVGVLAMSAYWQIATEIAGQDPRKMPKREETPDELKSLDSLSIVGQQHEEGESSTAAMGRIAYEMMTGKEPRSKETRTVLSYLVHWMISAAASGTYGAIRGATNDPDIQGGVVLGTSLWLLGDEFLMPVLGLTDGPTAYPSELHAYSWGAHIAYGVACSITTQLLEQLF